MEYKVEITYKRVKYLRMKVKDGIVKISCPFLTSKKTIERFVNDNQDFIQKQLTVQFNNKINNSINFNDSITIFEHQYQILPISTKAKITDHFLFLREDKDLKKQIKALFKPKLLELIYQETLKYFTLMSLQTTFPKIIIKDVKSKWGSYNKKSHTIEYASELIFKDKEVYRYLIVHELSHIVYFDHSKNFYELVAKYCPDYKELRKKLKGM